MSEGNFSDLGVAAATAVHELVDRRQTLSVAESLTGGLLAATIVEIPGVSSVFRGGVVVYATDLKHTLAGVPQRLLDERGPVDPDVALALAEGVRQRCGSDWGLATTGVAGPGGGTVRELSLSGSRADIRVATVTSVLSLLVAELRGSPAGIPG